MSKNQITPFGLEVKRALKAKGMTQGDLAEKLGVTKQYLYNILYGKRPGSKYLPVIAKICGITMFHDSTATNKTGESCEDLFEENNETGDETGRDSKETPKRRKKQKRQKKQTKQKETHSLTPFGEMVVEALYRMHMKQVDLAIEIGTSKQYLYMILHGNRSGKKYLPAIAKVCGIELESALEPESAFEIETSKTND